MPKKHHGGKATESSALNGGGGILRPWWIKLLFFGLAPAVAGYVAGEYVKKLLPDAPEIIVSFLKEAHHFLPIVGLIGFGIVIGTLALNEILERMVPEVTEEITQAIRQVGSDIISDANDEVVPQFTSSMSGAIRDLGPVLARGIVDKEFFTNEMVQMLQTALAGRPLPPPVETEDPDLIEARRLLEQGQIDAALEKLETTLTRTDLSSNKRKKTKELLLQFAVFGIKEEHWKKAEPLLDELGTFEFYSMLAYKYWTARKVSKSIAFADQSLKRAMAGGDALEIARAKNNVAYYLADAKIIEREEQARSCAAESFSAVKAMLEQGVKAVTPVLLAKVLTTVGYVRITFAKSVAECLDGLEECSEGVRQGADQLLFESRHMIRAQERLAELRRATTE